MKLFQRFLEVIKRPSGIILAVVLIASIILVVFSYRLAIQGPQHNTTSAAPKVVKKKTSTPTPTPIQTPTPSPTPTQIVLPPQNPADILGVEGNSYSTYTDIPWIRLGHTTCGWANPPGSLKDIIQTYHSKGTRVLLTVCQSDNDDAANTNVFNEVAQAYPDAVQCGNEQMKQDSSVSFLYMQPDKFAKFYDSCEHTVHSVRPDIPVLVGSLDPHVAGNDYQLMVNQAYYLDQMQDAMNSTVHPGGNWDWHNQALGVIDSWHNGYWGANNLAGVFAFWAQQFHVDVNSGDLGKHLWVVEGTGCFKGCGLNPDNNAQVAAAHVLALVTDVKTAMDAKVPFFYFSGKDFKDQGVYWPIGILDADGNPKPIRQDLGMGARSLTMSCPNGGDVNVVDQAQLLAKMYAHCSLPGNYVDILDG